MGTPNVTEFQNWSTMNEYIAYWTISRRTNSRSVKLRKGQLAAWTIHGLLNPPKCLKQNLKLIMTPNVIRNSLLASWLVHKSSSLWVEKSMTRLTASWFVGELSGYTNRSTLKNPKTTTSLLAVSALAASTESTLSAGGPVFFLSHVTKSSAIRPAVNSIGSLSAPRMSLIVG